MFLNLNKNINLSKTPFNTIPLRPSGDFFCFLNRNDAARHASPAGPAYSPPAVHSWCGGPAPAAGPLARRPAAGGRHRGRLLGCELRLWRLGDEAATRRRNVSGQGAQCGPADEPRLPATRAAAAVRKGAPAEKAGTAHV